MYTRLNYTYTYEGNCHCEMKNVLLESFSCVERDTEHLWVPVWKVGEILENVWGCNSGERCESAQTDQKACS